MSQIQTIIEAIRAGNVDSIRTLLEAEPSLASQQTEHGVSLLMFAAYYRNPAIVQLFRQRRTELTVYEAAAIGDVAELQRHLQAGTQSVDASASDGFSTLGLASFFGHLPIAEALVKAGADVNLAARNSFKVRPLHSAAASRQLEIARLLLANGADPNVRQQHDVTPLHSAAHNGQEEMVQLLLQYGADTAARTTDGKTALDMAREDGHEGVVQILEG